MGKETKIRQLHTAPPFERYFEEVYAEFFKPLYLYARSLTKSNDIAKDVVSDVFFNLWKSKSDLTQIKELKYYLFRAVKNQVIRTMSYDPRAFDSINAENYVKRIEKVNPEEILLEKELVVIIDKAISTLPDQCRLIFDMAKNQQMRYSEIADELGISQSTIKTQVARAIAIIKQAIEEQYNSKKVQTWKHYGLANTVLYLMLILHFLNC